MPYEWNVREVLQVCDGGRCVGYAPSCRRQCNNPIKYDNAKNMTSVILEISQQRPDPELLLPKLCDLAEYGLCRRNHQYQVDDIVAKWTQRIKDEYPTRESMRSARVQTSSRSTATPSTAGVYPRASSGRTSQSSTFVTGSPRSSSTEQSEIQTLIRTIADMQATMRATQSRLDMLVQENSSISSVPTPSRTSTSDISFLSLSRSATVVTAREPPTTTHGAANEAEARSSPSPPSPSPRVASPSHTIESSTSAPISVSNTTITEPVVPSTQCSRTHVRRRPLEDECPICYEAFDDEANFSSTNIVWCKSGCGRSIHKECVEAWHAEVRSSDRPLTCSICRVDWAPHCECTSGCTAQHARRKPVDRECPICQDSMWNEEGERPVMEELTWCKDGCGKSVHEVCFATWRAACEESGREATCVSCRGSWTHGCEC